MGIASLSIGIIVICFAFIPILNYGILLPCILGLGFGLAELLWLRKKSLSARDNESAGQTGYAKQDDHKSKSIAIAGTTLNALALSGIILWTAFFSYNLRDLFRILPGFETEEALSQKPKHRAPSDLRKFQKDFAQDFFKRSPHKQMQDIHKDFQKALENFFQDIERHGKGHFRKEFKFRFPQRRQEQKHEKDQRRKKISPDKYKKPYEKRYKEVI